jgi:hypothetical protein
VETFLKQLEAQIAAMAPADREAASVALATVIRTLQKYPVKITAVAFFKFISLLGIANGTDGMDRWKVKLKERSAKVGPHVAAVFQAL